MTFASAHMSNGVGVVCWETPSVEGTCAALSRLMKALSTTERQLVVLCR